MLTYWFGWIVSSGLMRLLERLQHSLSMAVVKDGHVLDNRWVVPHNVALLKRYQAHMNVEWCNKTNLVKFLFKYITKGPDRANVAVCPVGGSSTGQQHEEGVDEVAEYKSCRYLSACESF
jgi:hypothetical protein